MIIRTDYKKALIREIIIIALILAVFLVFFFLLRANIENESKTIGTLQEQRSLLIESTQGLSILKGQWDEARLYRDEVALLIPQRDDLVMFNNKLTELAAGDNVSFSFSFGNEDPGGSNGLGLIAFSATAEGNVEQLLSFLENLEDQFFSIRIDTLDVRDQERSDTLRLTMGGYVYFKKT